MFEAHGTASSSFDIRGALNNQGARLHSPTFCKALHKVSVNNDREEGQWHCSQVVTAQPPILAPIHSTKLHRKAVFYHEIELQ